MPTAARNEQFSGGVPYALRVTSAPIDPLIGQTLNERYVIRSRIARGGMAMVYLATDLRLERKVAVKVMHEHLAEDENYTRRFDREARSAAKLSHANLVNVFDQGHDVGRTYLVMEYLPNITLRQLLKKQKRLTLEQSLEIADAILAGLAAAHAAGIVHRDLKPENVLLVDDGRIKIGDFGLARAVSANTTTGQALLGTIAYLSPELVTRGIADKRSDLYAFGIMMYEMLTGAQPFIGEQPMQIAYQHAHSDVPAPSAHSDVSTPAVDELVLWLTQRDADLRPLDAGEALEYLQDVRRDPYAMPEALKARPLSPEELAATSVLTTDDLGAAATTKLSATTTVFDQVHEPDLAGASHETAQIAPPRASAADRVRTRGAKRARRGRLIAVLLVLLVAGAGFAGVWFGQGPGSQVSVPDVTGFTMEQVAGDLAELDLLMDTSECSSLDIGAGLAVSSTPAPGTRLDRGATVNICQSTGPELLEVPTLVGLELDDAIARLEEQRFTFGEVVDTRFSDSDVDVVLAALDENDTPLEGKFPEQGVINLVVSAGQLPTVQGMSEADAVQSLSDRRLKVDSSLNTESHDEEIPKGHVIALLPATDPVRPGDSVGLHMSLGPELFEVPDVSGRKLRKAIEILAEAGFSPVTDYNELIQRLATVSGTTPTAGEAVPRGTAIHFSLESDD